LLWAAIWLFDATGDQSYLQYLINNAASLGGTGNAMDQFSWDNKYAGVQLKATKVLHPRSHPCAHRSIAKLISF
jgi:hypothetical protein